MSDTLETLSKTEYDTVGEMLLKLISQCPVIDPDTTIKYQSMDADSCLGIFTMAGAKYLKRNVQGGFTAQIRFQVAYKGLGTGNGDNIQNQAYVDSIMDWLEKVEDLPNLSNGRTITKITATNSVAYTDSTGNDNSITFAADATMEYESE